MQHVDKKGVMPLEDRETDESVEEEEHELVGEDDEELEPDTSEERTAEAGMSSGDFETVPADDISFEDDESGVAT